MEKNDNIYKLPVESSKLERVMAFSNKFRSIIGKNNSTNVFGLENKIIIAKLIDALIFYFFPSFRSAVWERLKNLMLRIGINLEQKSYGHTCLTDDAYIRPTFGYNKKHHIIDYMREHLNFNYNESISFLEGITKIKRENITEYTCYTKPDKKYIVREEYAHPPQRLIPYQIGNAVNSFNLQDYKYFTQSDGNIHGAASIYEYGGIIFCVPATAWEKEMTVGMVQPHAQLLNQDLIDKYHKATIIIFQDMRAAMYVHEKLIASSNYDSSNPQFIVTAHLGTNIDKLPWSLLSYRDVIFVAAPDPRSMAMAKSYAKYCNDNNVSEFKVAQRMYLRYPRGADEDKGQLSRAEQEVLARCDYMEDVTDLVEWFKLIIDSPFPIQEYERLWKNVGLFHKSANEKYFEPEQDSDNSRLPDQDKTLVPDEVFELAEMTQNHTFQGGTYILMVGRKDVGKTRLTLALCEPIIKGKGKWPWLPPAGQDGENICLVDGETPHSRFERNLKLLGLDIERGSRLHTLSKFDKTLPDFCKSFSLKSPIFRE